MLSKAFLFLLAFLSFTAVLRSEDKGYDVLISAQNSKFKDALHSYIKDGLSKNGISVRSENIKYLNEVNIKDYKAIVIINTCKVWRLNGYVRKFLKNLAYPGKVILFTTAGGPGWKAKKVDADAVSCASKMETVKEKSDLILDKIYKIIDKNK